MNREGWSLLLYFYLRFVQLIHQLFSSVVSLLLIRWTHKIKSVQLSKYGKRLLDFKVKHCDTMRRWLRCRTVTVPTVWLKIHKPQLHSITKHLQ